MTELAEFVPGRIWLREYPVQYAGARFLARMTVLRLDSGKLLIHSPCGIDNSLHTEICGLGEVSYLVAPGTYHYFYIRPAQARYPNAQTYICPGIEQKRPEIRFDWILGDRSPPEWVFHHRGIALTDFVVLTDAPFLKSQLQKTRLH